MRTALIITGILVVLLGAIFMMRRGTSARVTASNNPYSGLRAQALSMAPSEVGVTASEVEVWGILMDLPVSGATATVVAFADGAASIYLSSGGGFIGGAREPVRRSGEAFLAEAKRVRTSFTSAGEYPLPSAGKVRFYVRLGRGVAVAEASEQELQSG